MLGKNGNRYVPQGNFTTEVLTLPPKCRFTTLEYQTETPTGTTVSVNLLDANGRPVQQDVAVGTELNWNEPVQLQFLFTTNKSDATPKLDSYSLSFGRFEP